MCSPRKRVSVASDPCSTSEGVVGSYSACGCAAGLARVADGRTLVIFRRSASGTTLPLTSPIPIRVHGWESSIGGEGSGEMTSADKVDGSVDEQLDEAEPLVDKILEKAEQLAEDVKEKAEQLGEKVMEKAEPLIEKVREKAEPLVEKATENLGKDSTS